MFGFLPSVIALGLSVLPMGCGATASASIFSLVRFSEQQLALVLIPVSTGAAEENKLVGTLPDATAQPRKAPANRNAREVGIKLLNIESSRI
jgi:hypothetical protein